MALPKIKRAEADRDLRKYCAETPEPEIRNEIRYTYNFRGNDVTLTEERPPWDGRGAEWTKRPIARFRYEPERNGWSVSWLRRNHRWHGCDWIGSVARFGEALDEVKRDVYGTFFG